jgi:hypothetical protein
MAPVLRLAAKPPLPIDSVAERIAHAYPRATVKLYDHGPPAPRDRVVPDELGRMLIFGARLTFVGAVDLLEHQPPPHLWDVPWDAALLDVDADVGGGLYKKMLQLYRHLAHGPKGNARRPALASKLLHRKWPDFFPVLDSRVVAYYSDAAQAAARRRSRSGALYSAAIRNDLLANGAARRGQKHPAGSIFSSLRDRLMEIAAASSDETRRHVDRVLALSDVRLHDMAVWSTAGRHPIAASPCSDVSLFEVTHDVATMGIDCARAKLGGSFGQCRTCRTSFRQATVDPARVQCSHE